MKRLGQQGDKKKLIREGVDTYWKAYRFANFCLKRQGYPEDYLTEIEALRRKLREKEEESKHFRQLYEQNIEYDKSSAGTRISIESPEKVIFFERKGIDEPIPFEMESLGNRNLLQLLPAFFHCIEQGGMLLLDEFSSGFHNDLEQLLLRYFMNKADRAQLIFVSHSTNLLSNIILRPDQIYSVDFDGEGSTIKRFSSEKPREAQNLEKMYLGGVFKGVPAYEHKFK